MKSFALVHIMTSNSAYSFDCCVEVRETGVRGLGEPTGDSGPLVGLELLG
jgi:hypothetical protein